VALLSLPPIRAVLFDYGIVLSGPASPDAWARMKIITHLDEATFAAAYWYPRHDYDRGVLSGSTFWHAAAQHAGIQLSHTQVADLLDADNDLWTNRNQPMVDWALRLQAAGMKTGILSNLGDAISQAVVSRQPWLAGFDHVVWSYTCAMAKPEPAIYQYSISGLGIDPASVLFIDDRPVNIAAGAAAGLRTILYTTQANFEAEMSVHGLEELWQLGCQAVP
jgi:putative hydrolase of the HAD superfamily